MDLIRQKGEDICPELRDQAMNELGMFNALRHPYIIKLANYFQVDFDDLKICFAFLEYANGGDLIHYMRAKWWSDGRIRSQSVLRADHLCCQIHACLSGGPHRDIKPANVLMTSNKLLPNSPILEHA